MTTTATAERTARNLAANIIILDRFNDVRASLGHDYGAGQRARELIRLRVELRDTLRRDNTYLRAAVDRLEEGIGYLELVAAWDRIATPRRRRIEREDYRRSTPATKRTITAWNRIAFELDNLSSFTSRYRLLVF